MRITYAAATSLDGFIAKEDGDVSWLDGLDIDPKETGLEEFFATIDGLVMGRKTYDFVFNYGAWPYEDKPTWVCTHHELQALEGANLFVEEEIDAVIAEAKSKGLQHLWLVGGGQLASAFLEKGLISDLSISEMPIKLDSGIPLFANHDLNDSLFEQKKVIQRNGFRRIEIVIKT